MEEHCKEHGEVLRLVREIHSALIGNEEKAGIYERVRSLESMRNVVIGLVIAVLGYTGQFIYTWIVSGIGK